MFKGVCVIHDCGSCASAFGEQELGVKAQSLEALFVELESLVERLEQGDHSLEESLRLFERGVVLCREGGQRLDQAEQDIRQLLRDGQSGAWQREPWIDSSSQEAGGTGHLAQQQGTQKQEDDEDDDDDDDESSEASDNRDF